MKYLLTLVIIVTNFYLAQAQYDFGAWNSFSLNMKLNDMITMKARPIIRHNDDLSSFNNSSIDISMHFKFNKNWNAMILERHFFIPDGPDREFLFFDLTHKTGFGNNFSISNRIRYHFALDLSRLDPDFIRYQPTLSYGGGKKLKPFVAIDAWLRLTGGPTEWSGSRYILGANYNFTDKLGLNTQFWIQDGYNEAPLFQTYFIVTTLNIKIDALYPKTPDTQIGK